LHSASKNIFDALRPPPAQGGGLFRCHDLQIPAIQQIFFPFDGK
jgi:hypothetical protein